MLILDKRLSRHVEARKLKLAFASLKQYIQEKMQELLVCGGQLNVRGSTSKYDYAVYLHGDSLLVFTKQHAKSDNLISQYLDDEQVKRFVKGYAQRIKREHDVDTQEESC